MNNPDNDVTAPDTQLVLSYLALRQALGWLGLLLPAALLSHSALPGNRLEASISDYYYTTMGGVLTGVLSAIGVFLLAYHGYVRKRGEWLSDRWLSRLAGTGAIGVALLPVHRDGYPVCIDMTQVCWIFGASAHPEFLHYATAGLFFLCLSAFALVQFPRGERDASGNLMWTGRTFLFLLCGTAILAMLVAIAVYFVSGAETKAALTRRHYLFWCETVAIFAFSISWLVKGRAMRSMGAAIARIGGRA